MPHWETRLALDVLQEDFGVTVRVVAEALAELGPASLREVFGWITAFVPQRGWAA